MKTFLRLVLVISFFFVGTLVLSQFDDFGDQGLSTQAVNKCNAQTRFCDRVSVNRLSVNVDGNLYISTSGRELDLASHCTPYADYYLKISNQAENYKEIYTTLLTAKLTSTPVTIKISAAATCSILFVHLGDL